MATNLFEHAGLRVEIAPDPMPVSPREDADLLGRMVFWHPRMLLGDEPSLQADTNAGELARARAAKVWLPLSVLERDGSVALRVDRVEDGALAADGLIYATARQIKTRLRLLRVSRRTLAEAEAILRREVQDYGQFIAGEMLQFTISDQDGQPLDRRGGFYTLAYATEEAMRVAEQHARQLERYAPQRLVERSALPPG
jgi:hypothetical protein